MELTNKLGILSIIRKEILIISVHSLFFVFENGSVDIARYQKFTNSGVFGINSLSPLCDLFLFSLNLFLVVIEHYLVEEDPSSSLN